MGASIVWQPIESSSLGVNTPSHFIEVMERAFGKLPLTLDIGSIPILQGIVAAQDDYGAKPFSDLIDAIQKHENIRVWAEW